MNGIDPNQEWDPCARSGRPRRGPAALHRFAVEVTPLPVFHTGGGEMSGTDVGKDHWSGETADIFVEVKWPMASSRESASSSVL